MSTTSANIVSVLLGVAPDDVCTQFLNDVARSDEQVAQMLSAVEAWSVSRLSPDSPSPQSPLRASGGPAITIIKKAAFWDDEQGDEEAGVQELVQYVRGLAAPDVVEKLKKTLARPTSKLAKMLREMERGESRDISE